MRNLLFYCSIVLIAISGKIYAQTWDWARTPGGNGADGGAGVATDARGNVFMTGSFGSSTIAFGSTTLTNMGLTDVYLVKYDRLGTVIWARGSGGTRDEYAIKVATDAAGDAIITGYFQSDSITFGTVTLHNGNPGAIDNMFVVKYDSSGNVLWARSSGDVYNDMGAGVATDASGNVIVIGNFYGPDIVLGNDTLLNSGTLPNPDAFIVKYDAAGNQLWAQSAGGSQSDKLYGIATDDTGNIYVTGATFSPSFVIGGDTMISPGGCRTVTAKMDGSGHLKWASESMSADNIQSHGIAIDAAGNAYITGAFIGDSVTIGPVTLFNDSAFYSTDMFLVKYDGSGNVVWAKRAGEPQSAAGTGIVVDHNNNIYVTGSFYSPHISFGPDTLTDDTANYGYNMFVARYDAYGNSTWGSCALGTASSNSAGIAMDDSGALYMCGHYSVAPIIFGTTISGVPDSLDAFLVKLTPPVVTSVKDVTTNSNNMQVYPVPANDVVKIILGGTGYSVISICDLAGREVIRRVCDEGDKDAHIVIHMGTLAKGNYIVKAVQSGQCISKRLVVE